MTGCSVVIPVHDHAATTRACLEAVLGEPPRVDCELIVVDDGSTDPTPDVLALFGDAVRVIRRDRPGGFAAACNDGAAAARHDHIVFLNNDTVPRSGWLDALADHARLHRHAVAVGSKLLYPNGAVQHAGVVFDQDGWPRHLYSGFPADHPAVNRSRRFQAVTGACMLVRRTAFEDVGGFDTGFLNSLEDVDLCLRLGERGGDVHYCHRSVLGHLESASRGRAGRFDRSVRLYRDRWRDRVRRDDVDYYLADGLLRLSYNGGYPVHLEVDPELAVLEHDGRDRDVEQLLGARSREVSELLAETVRLTGRIAELELGTRAPALGAVGGSMLAEEVAYELQCRVSTAIAGRSAAIPFEPSRFLGYRRLVRRLREAVADVLPDGATVLIVSRGDDELLDLGDFDARHFPQDRDGGYAGYHPADGAAAIAHLEELRARGADFLLVPATSLWWLEHYGDLALHLDERCETVLDHETCRVFAL